MHARRTVLKLWAAGLLAWALPGAAPAVARPVPAGNGMYLVNGWLLSPADLARLGLDEAFVAAGQPARPGSRVSAAR